MDTPASSPTGTSTPPSAANAASNALTPDLVAKVTEKVYQMLLADLRLERERSSSSRAERWSLPGGLR